MNYLLPLLQWPTVIIPGSWFFEAPGSSPRYQDDHDPSSWSRSVITKLLSRDTAGVITWLDWHTHPRTSHTNISHLRSVILSLFYSPGSGGLMSALSSHCRVQKNIGCCQNWIESNTRDPSEKLDIGMLLGHDAAVDESGSTSQHTRPVTSRERWEMSGNEMEARPDPDFF